MRQIEITDGEAGQRLDKFLRKYMKDAPGGFLYKMLRKKNITLNSKKADGSERLAAGDLVRLFLSEEALAVFGAGDAGGRLSEKDKKQAEEGRAAYQLFGKLQILYEDRHVLLVDKPAGILSQKADNRQLSLNEWLTGYLLETGKITEQSLQTFHPSVCNRLDRNTSGIVICGKSLYGSQEMSRIIEACTNIIFCMWKGKWTEEKKSKVICIRIKPPTGWKFFMAGSRAVCGSSLYTGLFLPERKKHW